MLLFRIFNDFSQTIISTSTRPIVAKFAGMAELWLQMIGLKLVIHSLRDFAMATKSFLVLLHGCRWTQRSKSKIYDTVCSINMCFISNTVFYRTV